MRRFVTVYARAMLPATPYLHLDVAVLRRNLQRAAELAQERSLVLRPHVKTHKCVEIARLQQAYGSEGLTVASLGEAEAFVDAGFTDLFIAFPVWLEESQRPRVEKLIAKLPADQRLRVGVDSPQAAQRWFGLDVDLIIEIDSGMHRSGVTPQGVVAVAQAASAVRLPVIGIFTFPGHSYGLDLALTVAHEEACALAEAREALLAAGFPCDVVSGGSTPSFPFIDPSLTEARPGVYCVNDAQQWELGSCRAEDIALTCVATVVSKHTHSGRDYIVTNAGSKIIGADRPSWTTGHGRVPASPGARITSLSEHHSVIAWEGPSPELGSQIQIAPNHACNAFNLVDEVYAEVEGELSPWRVIARGLNS